MNVVTGFDLPSSGTVELEGDEITTWPPYRRARAGLARTFQHGHLFPGLSVRENVAVSALGVGASPQEAARRADELLAVLGLEDRAATRAAVLPHGVERKLGVARALAGSPRFVLMDEPAAGLHEGEVAEFAEVVRRVCRDRDAGVLLIDHNIALILEVSDRIYVLDEGRVLAEGTPAEIRANAAVASAYLGRRSSGKCPMADATVLEVMGLEVRYGSVPAVQGLSFDVARGEVVALVGPNGAGKSTTLLALMGVVAPWAGEIRLHGDSLAGRAPEDVARAGVALVPEGRHIFGHFTVEENLRLGLVGRRQAQGAQEDLERVYELFPVYGSSGAARPVCCRAGSSSSSPSLARSSPVLTCSSWTNRLSASLPPCRNRVRGARGDPRAGRDDRPRGAAGAAGRGLRRSSARAERGSRADWRSRPRMRAIPA